MIENAKIESTSLGREDHGILTAYVHLQIGGGAGGTLHGGCGGFAFDGYDRATKRRKPHAFGTAFIMGVLDTLGVTSWEKLPGTPCRVDHDGLGGGVKRIGHFLEDRWFDPREVAAEMKDE